jgi:hypothetical protein
MRAHFFRPFPDVELPITFVTSLRVLRRFVATGPDAIHKTK